MSITEGQDLGAYDVVVIGGAAAAAQINADLVAEETRHAVTAYRARREAQTAGRR